jgi:colanic acid biosynthesis glycosyl transferase WcaI
MGVVRGRLLPAVARFLEGVAWRCASRVVLIGDELRGVAERRAVDGSRISTIANWADTETIRPREASAFRSELGYASSDFVVEYAGNFGRSQDLDTVLEAARIVERDSAGLVKFLLIGEGSAAAEVRERARGIANVRVAPYQPEDRLADVLSAADLSLIPLRRGLTRFCVPSKIYSILASGRPVGAAIDDDSEVARIIERGQCGFRVDPDDSAAMAAEILHLAGDPRKAREMGRKGRQLGEQAGSLGRAVGEYETVLTEVCNSFPGSSVSVKNRGTPSEE